MLNFRRQFLIFAGVANALLLCNSSARELAKKQVTMEFKKDPLKQYYHTDNGNFKVHFINQKNGLMLKLSGIRQKVVLVNRKVEERFYSLNSLKLDSVVYSNRKTEHNLSFSMSNGYKYNYLFGKNKCYLTVYSESNGHMVKKYEGHINDKNVLILKENLLNRQTVDKPKSKGVSEKQRGQSYNLEF